MSNRSCSCSLRRTWRTLCHDRFTPVNSNGRVDGVDDPVERLRAICLALPEVTERASHGEPCFFIRAGSKGKQFVSVDDHHHGADRLAFWCAAPPGAQEALIAADADRYFRPPYVGH